MTKAADKMPPELTRLDWDTVRAWLRDNPDLLRDDEELLLALGLQSGNIVALMPPSIAELREERDRALRARRSLEQLAKANFQVQEQAQAAVLSLLEARSNSDLARRVDETARSRFNLVGGAIALEGPGPVPVGWRALDPDGVDALLGPGDYRLGQVPEAAELFGPAADQVKSVALIRVEFWMPMRRGILAYASDRPEHYARGMATEMIDFLAGVIERTVERWPVL